MEIRKSREAIEVINECIQGNPEYQHYQDQKLSF